MLLDIRHITEYRYDAPVRESVMELWMQPRMGPTQRMIAFDLSVDPLSQVFSYGDCWGNTVHHFDVPHPHERLATTVRAVVETYAPPPLPPALDFAAWDTLRGEAVRGECWDFLHPHGFATANAALRAFRKKKKVDELLSSDPLSAVKALNTLLYRAFDYERGVTAADSPIDHALAEGRGVCQDFAHIMIAICRSWGVPARYVSGYLHHTENDDHDRSDPGATHAWVEVFLPTLGWVGFDPTNNTLAAERHVTVAIGRDYADTPPSRGVFKGDAESQLSVGVSVRASTNSGEPEFLRFGAPAIAAARRRAATAAILDQHQQHQQQQQ